MHAWNFPASHLSFLGESFSIPFLPIFSWPNKKHWPSVTMALCDSRTSKRATRDQAAPIRRWNKLPGSLNGTFFGGIKVDANGCYFLAKWSFMKISLFGLVSYNYLWIAWHFEGQESWINWSVLFWKYFGCVWVLMMMGRCVLLSLLLLYIMIATIIISLLCFLVLITNCSIVMYCQYISCPFSMVRVSWSTTQYLLKHLIWQTMLI